MHNEQKLQINPEFIVEKFDNEILLYSQKGTLGMYLNDTAHVLWLLCGENLTIGQIIQSLEEMFPEQKSQIRKDVNTAINDLMNYGAVNFSENRGD